MQTIDLIAAAIFAIALIHIFLARYFEPLARRQPRHAGLFHLLGEVEIIFGLWALVLILFLALLQGGARAIAYVESRQYTEPMFVFVIMVIAASRPVLALVQTSIRVIAHYAPVSSNIAYVWLSLAIVPLAGSLITEPAAMTLAALLLAPLVFHGGIPERRKYFTLGVLFVNISIGGTLSAFAAPPVLMVAKTWGWDSMFMAMNFGWKAGVAVVLNATAATWLLRSHLAGKCAQAEGDDVPVSISAVHILFLAAVVFFAHHPAIFVAVFLFFLGFTQAYPRHQAPLLLKEGLLVGFFLAGLVALGGMQQWWLQPLMSGMKPLALYFGAIGLTAITDNAALTYLGSLVQGISDEGKYSLVAGAVAGGGLTVIANAPNPAGAALLKNGFQDGAIGVGGLLAGALLPTAVASLIFLL